MKVEGYTLTRGDLGSRTNPRAALCVGKHECHKRLQDLAVSYFLSFLFSSLWRAGEHSTMMRLEVE